MEGWRCVIPADVGRPTGRSGCRWSDRIGVRAFWRPMTGRPEKERNTMRVFMLGWEFPPFISGGLGTACYGLTKAMSGLGTEILFVLPRPVTSLFSTHCQLLNPRPCSPRTSPVTESRHDALIHGS